MSERPMISVIVPVYNAEKTLDRCLESINNQSYSEFEVILINDGSKDNSDKICDKYVNENQRFKVIHTSNCGVSSARNTGIRHIQGKYVMFVDSDDYIYPDYFETYIKHAEENQREVVIGGLLRKENERIEKMILTPIGEVSGCIWNNICIKPEGYGYIAGKMIVAKVIKDNHIRLNEKMYSQEDLDFNLSVYEKCSKIELIDYAGYEYEYIPRKRKPPVWDFIANSLKMYRIAIEKSKLSDEAMHAIKSRVVSQIFTFLYVCDGKEEFDYAIEKLCQVNGLRDYLSIQNITGESKHIIRWFLAKDYQKIYKYFCVRKGIKKLMGKPISE